MLNTLISCASFLFAICLVVTVHEFGHFIVARWCGVRVLRFSIGFGKPLIRWQDKRHTEFVIAPILLGGYVKMLDERTQTVPDILRPYTFNGQSVWRRIAILLAGPVANFILAILLFSIVLIVGQQSRAPIVEEIRPYTPISYTNIQVGDDIIAVDGQPTDSWKELTAMLSTHMGNAGSLILTVHRAGVTQPLDIAIQHTHWPKEIAPEMLLDAVGIGLIPPDVPAKVGVVQTGSSAAIAGLQAGDEIRMIAQQPVMWASLVNIVKAHPDETLSLSVYRKGQLHTLDITIGHVLDVHGQKQGQLGIGIDTAILPQAHWRWVHYNPWDALIVSGRITWEYSKLTFKIFYKMLAGHVSFENLSGPVMMAQAASETAHTGLAHYLSFLALISIGIGFFNLLPIPILDGGHVVFCLIEGVIRRPLSIGFQEWGMRLGGLLLICVTIISFYNDLLRVF